MPPAGAKLRVAELEGECDVISNDLFDAKAAAEEVMAVNEELTQALKSMVVAMTEAHARSDALQRELEAAQTALAAGGEAAAAQRAQHEEEVNALRAEGERMGAELAALARAASRAEASEARAQEAIDALREMTPVLNREMEAGKQLKVREARSGTGGVGGWGGRVCGQKKRHIFRMFSPSWHHSIFPHHPTSHLPFLLAG
jgi:hypothetical protein